MLVKAWQCGMCGMLTPATEAEDEELPDGWVDLTYTYQRKMNADAVCSPKCASKLFAGMTDKKPKTAAKKAVPAIKANGKNICPECGKAYDLPQHLGMHRKRAHGVPSERDQQARKG